MRRRIVIALLAVLAALGLPTQMPRAQQDGQVVVASKSFTESVILGEILTKLARDKGVDIRHWQELGGTRVIWDALKAGELDAYVDYTGTLTQEILRLEASPDLAGLAEILRDAHGIGITAPLGFSNSYAIGLKRDLAERLAIETISDLGAHPGLTFGFSTAFMNRQDGWPGLREAYGLPQGPTGLDHDLALKGVETGQLDATDVYTTDPEISTLDLRVLVDDLGYFPDYSAVVVYALRLEEKSPEAVRAFHALAGRIDAATMRGLNLRAKMDGVSAGELAAGLLNRVFGLSVSHEEESNASTFWRHTADHMKLVGLSLGAAILLAIPLGIWAFRRPKLGRAILAAVSIVQTIPSLALFVFLIPLLGIGFWPAALALFIYSLLPIVRNTHAGLTTIAGDVRESAIALGLPPMARLRLIELPIALPTILAGVKTSAVINVGTATLGALIGAGGYGQPILTGIRLADTALILSGAVPAAVLALLIQFLFDGIERWITSEGLRL